MKDVDPKLLEGVDLERWRLALKNLSESITVATQGIANLRGELTKLIAMQATLKPWEEERVAEILGDTAG